MSDVVEKEITLYFCPTCARSGQGSGPMNPSRFPDTLMCLECGWCGSKSKAQQHSYPCKVYKTVEMDVPVLINMWESLRPEKEPNPDPERTQVPFVLIGDAERFPSAMNVLAGQALDFLVNKGFLPVAHYRLDDPAQTR